MGHVDHGKTTLLSALKQTDLTKKEHGGITQHIDAYQLKYQGKKITFIDTPGHVAFAKMRSRGAKATDLAILVVAANDGVKPQTKESLKHIQKAKVPFLVAINKIDLPEASCDMVKSQLAEQEVLIEEYGGKIVCLEISAKQKKGLKELLEMILLMAQMEELTTDPKKNFEALVIESRLDTKKGPVAVLLVKNGFLKVGDNLIAENCKVKVKALKNDQGKEIKKAYPSQPVEVLGFKTPPPVGAIVNKTNEITPKDPIQKEDPIIPHSKTKLKTKAGKTKKEEEEPEEKEVLEKKEEKIKLVLKADTLGTLEAIKASLPDEIEIVEAQVGNITESDILLALSCKAEIIGFNVKTPKQSLKLAQTEGVEIKNYQIIYKLLEELEKKVLKIMEPTIDEEILAEGEIIAEFTIKGSHIAGTKIKKGKISKGDKIHLKRKNEIIANSRVKSLQKEKEEVTEIKAGNNAGIVLSPDLDFNIGDAIISYSDKI